MVILPYLMAMTSLLTIFLSYSLGMKAFLPLGALERGNMPSAQSNSTKLSSSF